MYSTGDYDTIVLDTPPSQNAAAFLWPGRVVDFLQDDVVQWLMKPQGTGLSWKVFNLSTTLITKTLGKMAGADTLNALIDFVKEFHGLYDGFRERAEAVQELLRSNNCHFVIVSTPKQAPLYRAKSLNEALRAQHMHVGAVVINRVQKPLFSSTSAASLQKEVTAALNAAQASAVWSVVKQTRPARMPTPALWLRSKRRWALPKFLLCRELPVDAHSLASLVSLERGLP